MLLFDLLVVNFSFMAKVSGLSTGMLSTILHEIYIMANSKNA
jgi:hypothetical protein